MKILLSILGLAYVLSPYDILSDFFVGWGWIDDLIVLFFLWKYIYVPWKKRGEAERIYQKNRQYFDNNKANRFAGNERYNNFNSGERVGSKDPYTVLGVGKNASFQEIKGAYKQLAGKYHPDKVVHLGEEFAELAEIRFKEIQKAYSELKWKNGA